MGKKAHAIFDGRKYLLTNIHDVPFRPTTSDCHYWIGVINQLIFNGSLPRFKTIKVRRMFKYWAWVLGDEGKKGRWCSIEMNSISPNFSAFFSILAHECIHSAEYHQMKTINHGKFFHSHKHLLKSVCGAALRTSYR